MVVSLVSTSSEQRPATPESAATHSLALRPNVRQELVFSWCSIVILTICLSGAEAVSFSSFLVALAESLLTGLESLLLEDDDALDEDAFETVAAAFLRAGMMDVRACQAC